MSVIDNKLSNRNYGIDCLRIVSMIMIVILHLLGQGGIILSTSPGTFENHVLWLLEACAYCAVNCYALISGYVGYKSKTKLSSLIKLTFTVLFYTIVTTIALFSFVDRNFSIGSLVRIFIPFGFGNNAYWYFTAYFCLFFLQPYINILINHLDKRLHKKLLVISILLFSVLPFLMNMDLFNTVGGYSVIWLIQLYVIGAYIGKYNAMVNKKTIFWCVLYLFSVISTWGLKTIFDNCHNFFFDRLYGSENFLTYTSPFVLSASLSLFMIFKKIQFSKFVLKIISFFTPMAFSVYLIHCSPLIWNYVLKYSLAEISGINSIGLIALTLFGAVLIWFVCSIIDLIRIYLFKLLKIDNWCIFIEKIIIKVNKKLFE